MFTKLTVTPLERLSSAKRQGLHYHTCIRVDVLSKHVSTLVQYLVRQLNNTFGGTYCAMFYHYFPHWEMFLGQVD